MSSDYDPYAVPTTDRDYGASAISYSDTANTQGPYEHTAFSKTYPGTSGADSSRNAGNSTSRLGSTALTRSPSPLAATLRDAHGASAGYDDGQLMQGWLWKQYGEGPHAQWKRRW